MSLRLSFSKQPIAHWHTESTPLKEYWWVDLGNSH